MFYAFDLLYPDGADLRARALDERRAALADLLAGADPAGWVRLSEEVQADGETLFRHARELGFEGIIAKDRRRPYRSGRGTDWLKIKRVDRESFLVIGYEPSSVARGRLGALLVACRAGDGLAYVGDVGTGFTETSARALRLQLDAIRTERPAVARGCKGIVWTEPAILAEVESRGWTGDGKLRHASYKGLRDEADAGEVYRR